MTTRMLNGSRLARSMAILLGQVALFGCSGEAPQNTGDPALMANAGTAGMANAGAPTTWAGTGAIAGDGSQLPPGGGAGPTIPGGGGAASGSAGTPGVGVVTEGTGPVIAPEELPD
jgi:hypothetical protein